MGKGYLGFPDAGFGVTSAWAPAGRSWNSQDRMVPLGPRSGGTGAAASVPREGDAGGRQSQGGAGRVRRARGPAASQGQGGSHSPRASAAWWGAGWGRSSCCRARRRCTGSGRCRPAATAASGWSRSSRTRGSRTGPPAGLRRQRGERAGEAAPDPSFPASPGGPGPQPRCPASLPAPFPAALFSLAAKPGAGFLFRHYRSADHLSNTSAHPGRPSRDPGKETVLEAEDVRVRDERWGGGRLESPDPYSQAVPELLKTKIHHHYSTSLPNPSKPHSNTDHWAPLQPTNIRGQSKAAALTFISSYFKKYFLHLPPVHMCLFSN